MAYDGPTQLHADGECPVTHPQTAFGGTVESGPGYDQRREAIREYTRVENVDVTLG